MSMPTDPTTQRAVSRVGTTLDGKWHLDALLGVGGMAAVYAATHRNGKRVAIKILHSLLSLEPGIRSRFLREGYAANKVAHPGAVSVLDDQETGDGSVFLVMDLLEGESLAARQERVGRIDIGEVLAVADQLLDVLAAAHDKGIIHRDLKPDNIFITRQGQVKILDFGIARVKELSSKSLATQDGSTLGTPAFMSPEQARGHWEEVDPRSDLWAVGATLYTLLTGQLVHQARTINEQLLAAMTVKAPSLSLALPELPPQVVELVDTALAFDRKDRWTDARAMQRAVRVAQQALEGNAITTAPKLSVPEAASAQTAALNNLEHVIATARPLVLKDAVAPATPQKPSRRLLAFVVVALACAAILGVLVGLRQYGVVGTGATATKVSESAPATSTAMAAEIDANPTTPAPPVSTERAVEITALPQATSSAKSTTIKPVVRPPIAPATQDPLDKRR